MHDADDCDVVVVETAASVALEIVIVDVADVCVRIDGHRVAPRGARAAREVRRREHRPAVQEVDHPVQIAAAIVRAK